MAKKSKPNNDLIARAEAALTDAERPRWEALRTALAQPDANPDALRPDFFAWGAALATRLGLKHPGALWGQLQSAARSKAAATAVRTPPMNELASTLPYPLGMKLREHLQLQRAAEEGAPAAQLPFQICAVMGVLVRLSALIAIQAYAEAGGKNAELNRLIIDRLRAPSDGGWLEVAQRLVKATGGKNGPPLVALIQSALSGKPTAAKAVLERARSAQGKSVRSGLQTLSALVSFRNALIHGEDITDADIARAGAQLELAVRAFSGLTAYRLEVRHGGQTWSLNGEVPRPIEDDSALPEDEPCLVHAEGQHPPVSLSPLLRFRAGEGDTDMDVDFDELYFLNAGSIERLRYIGYRATGQVDGKTLGSYEAFKGFIAKIPTPPIPDQPRIDFSELAAFHSRLFVGRSDVLAEVATQVAARPTQYLLLRALAGMGKSALMGVLLQADRNRTEQAGRAIPSAAEGLLRNGDRWIFHFCMPTDGRNSPTVALRSLIAQTCDHFGWKAKPWLSQDIEELKDKLFPALMAKASDALEGDQRLVVAIDALDEGIGAEQESVPSCIPGGTYERVVFLLSYRVDDSGHNSRVEKQLRHLPEARLTTLQTANPLSGLVREDVDRFLDKVAALRAGRVVQPLTRDATWAAATADSPTTPPTADPFYLRFLAEGTQSGAVRLDRSETVPESLDDAFEELWMGLPTDRDFLCHRVLLTLAILREYGEDALFSELFNRELPADEQLTPDDIAAVRRKAGKLLVYDGDRYGLFHDRFKRFLVGEQEDPIAKALEAG